MIAAAPQLCQSDGPGRAIRVTRRRHNIPDGLHVAKGEAGLRYS